MPAAKELEKRYEHVPINKILVDQKYQFRAALSPEVAEDYALAIEEGAKFPNLVVFDTGREDGLYTLVDGFQRLTAYEVNNYRKIHVDVITGTEEQALLYALNANATNGARYTNEDKRKRANFCFGHKTMSKWTDNKIASYLGVSQGFISARRREYEALRGIDDEVVIKTVQTKDGRTYDIDVKKSADKKGNKQGGRKKPVIPDEQKAALVIETEPQQLLLGEQHEEFTEDESVKVTLEPGILTSSDGLLKVTLGNLDDLLEIDEYDLIIYSSDISWVVDNQDFIIKNSNIILQGLTGEDINKTQNINTVANTYNLFLVGSRLIVVAYYCNTQVERKDEVIPNYESYLASLISDYVGDGGSVLIVDPLETLSTFSQRVEVSLDLFYSEKNLGLYQKELETCDSLGIVFEDNSDKEVF